MGWLNWPGANCHRPVFCGCMGTNSTPCAAAREASSGLGGLVKVGGGSVAVGVGEGAGVAVAAGGGVGVAGGGVGEGSGRVTADSEPVITAVAAGRLSSASDAPAIW